VRIALVFLALWILARAFGLDVQTMSAGNDVAMRLLRGLFDAIVILLVADFTWAILRTWIDGKLAEAGPGPGAIPGEGEGGGSAPADLDPAEARRRARLHTLLPILRNVGFVVLAVMAVLMALSALGIKVGPLLAGAGVVGVAVGFGAQTVVKDVISGMFYLLDDAFRVGEYIQSGSYKGTVEAFSLRSIRLRHHRGPLFIVPFGELGAVENMSRDWVIDKQTISVPYDTDLDQVKRIIKQIGKELAGDPEFAPHILQTLKMQGVEQFGEYAIEIRLKMMTRPGEQFVIRRRAFALIKKAFAASGIAFASPTVTVAGGEAASAAAAQQAVEMARKPPEAA
jgi:moderate conductance mechanosensitive channel